MGECHSLAEQVRVLRRNFIQESICTHCSETLRINRNWQRFLVSMQRPQSQSKALKGAQGVTMTGVD